MAEPKTEVALLPTGVLRIEGKDRIDLLHRLSTYDLRGLKSGQAASTVFTTSQGKMIDWVGLLARDTLLYAVTAAGRAEKLAEWLARYTIMEDVRCTDESAVWSLVVVQGADAARAVGLSDLPAVGGVVAHRDGLWQRGLAAYGARLEGLLPQGAAQQLLGSLEAAGARLTDAAELERRRLLAGVPSAEHEYKDPVNPLELRLAKVAVSWNKGCYIGQEVISRLDTYDKLARVLMGFEADAPVALPQKLMRGGKSIGRVTSWAASERGMIGLAIVERALARPGDAELLGSTASTPARLVDRPFWS